MKFAFILMGKYDALRDRTAMRDGAVQVVGVPDVGEACRVAAELQAAGVDCIELCGAFGEDGARKVIEATQRRIPVGYVVHLSEQDALFKALFGGE